MTSLRRSELALDIPSLAESRLAGLSGFDTATWLGLLAAAKLTESILNFLNSEVSVVLGSSDVKTKLEAQGFTPKPTTSTGFKSFIKEETMKFTRLIRANNISVSS